MSAAGPR
ncbi:hypothetical protein JL09_g6372 [Pichia kudriavzevii]|nr:hypothetical protein JL09_g6372 [Pichia kudriavzevii]